MIVHHGDTIYLKRNQRIRVLRKHKQRIFPKNNKKITLRKDGVLVAKGYGTTKIKGSNHFAARVKILRESDFCNVHRLEDSVLLTSEQRNDFRSIREALLRNNDWEMVKLNNLSEAEEIWFIMTGDRDLLYRNNIGDNLLVVRKSKDNYDYASGTKGSYQLITRTYQILKKKIKINNHTSKQEAVQKIYRYITNHAVYDYRDEKRINRNYSSYISPSQRFDGIINYGKGVCSAYSQLFQIFCAEAGIPCQLKRGYVSKSRRETDYHQWNQIRLGKRSYDIDPTDEPTPKTHKKIRELRRFKLHRILRKPLYYLDESIPFGPNVAKWYYAYR